MADRVARLADVARRAGVSVATVSRHVNGHVHLPEGTVARIEDAIAELGYHPNPHARSLSRGRSDTIGLVIPDIANLYFARLAAAVEREAARHGFGLVLCATLNTKEREREYLARLSRNGVDGIIFVTNHSDDGSLVESINGASRQIVILDEDVSGAHGSKVLSDNRQGGYLAGRHLVEAGHRRIAFFGGPESMHSTGDRLAGCRAALADLAPEAALTHTFFGDYTAAHGRACVEALITAADDTTALVVSSDLMMIGVMEALRDAGWRVPDRVSVIGFDDIAPFHLFDPPLTSIRQPVDAMGQRAVDLLIRGVNGEAGEPVVEHLPVELISRRSVSQPAGASRATRTKTKIKA
jgi:LacI family transcriptional regulator